ncbi:hypothetical protein Droror1_Dr00006228 [Drosera rotundifolia]
MIMLIMACMVSSDHQRAAIEARVIFSLPYSGLYCRILIYNDVINGFLQTTRGSLQRLELSASVATVQEVIAILHGLVPVRSSIACHGNWVDIVQLHCCRREEYELFGKAGVFYYHQHSHLT